ncbi:neutral zinc metallopeptidase [Actinopolyspora sp. BKK1]|uniref:neutral zinc metallopeptidase n=1 Tax=Actinopolyspora sp. BKK1 TaxID=2599394 RepID=UPI0013F655F4
MNEESHLVLLAHEYGHHVQRLSGILRASAERADESAESSPASLRVTRRKELQAECFAGMFVARAVEDGLLDRRRGVRLVETPGSAKMADTHGSPANQRRWRKAGFREGSTSACATWTASNDAVRRARAHPTRPAGPGRFGPPARACRLPGDTRRRRLLFVRNQ